MKKIIKSLFAFLVICLMALSLTGCNNTIKTINKQENSNAGKYAGQTVIIHTNDVHGAIEGYAYLPILKAEIEKEGGTVIMVDDGDFTSGTIYVSLSQGLSAITLMNQAGYDLITLGNHEFDHGYEKLKENLNEGQFNVVCSNVLKESKTIFDSEIIYQIGDLKIGFFGLLSPETQTKVSPKSIEGITFLESEDLYKKAQEEIDRLKTQSDLVICLSHLGVDEESIGNRSTDVLDNTTGLDFIIDGHSHTYMNEEKIQSTGSQFESIGLVIIDNATKKIVSHQLLSVADLAKDELVLATAKNVIDTVDTEFGAKFATTAYRLEGEKALIRSQETNLGDLVCDAILWSVLNETELKVDKEHVIAIHNGGGIRVSVDPGDISRSDIKSILPFGNTVAVDYITGKELLESLEASTYASPDSIGGFPQVSGMKITIDTSIPFDQGEQYPNSTYYAPNTIKRVTIDQVNGKPFDINATYAVVSNNFTVEGGDTYYAFKRAYDAGNCFDTSILSEDALYNYIKMELGGIIPQQYAVPQGRITIH